MKNRTAFCTGCKKIVRLEAEDDYDVSCPECGASIEYLNYDYYAFCDCGRKHVVFTQSDDSPEYRTDIRVLCRCGELVEIVIPVN